MHAYRLGAAGRGHALGDAEVAAFARGNGLWI
jgi:hypothetical protein